MKATKEMKEVFVCPICTQVFFKELQATHHMFSCIRTDIIDTLGAIEDLDILESIREFANSKLSKRPNARVKTTVERA